MGFLLIFQNLERGRREGEGGCVWEKREEGAGGRGDVGLNMEEKLFYAPGTLSPCTSNSFFTHVCLLVHRIRPILSYIERGTGKKY